MSIKSASNEELATAYAQIARQGMAAATQGYQMHPARDAAPWTIMGIAEELESRLGVEGARALLDPNGRLKPFKPLLDY